MKLTKKTFSLYVARTISQLSDHVKTNYINTRYFTREGIWYHLQPKHFVNVLLIHHMEECGNKEIVSIAALMREGLASYHHLAEAQSENSFSTCDILDIFKPFSKSDGTTTIPQVIIIDGAPGMGKTTLIKEIAYQWAESKLLCDTKLVFFMYLQDPEIKEIYDIQTFIHFFYNFDKAAAEFSKQCAGVLINRSNDDIAILLDGYDEYFDASGDLFITNVLNRKVFGKCKLIVTSRPTATYKLQHIGDIRVEVMGFTDDSKKEYIKQELKNYPGKIKTLFSYLENNTAIGSICYIPVVMTILVCTFRENEELPSDQTEIYEKFITFAISRYVKKLEGPPNPKIIRLQNLPKSYQNYLSELAKFAFDNLNDDKIVFTTDDIEKSCPNLSLVNKDYQGLGLLKATQYFSMKKVDNCLSYNYLHLSIQEFLAAYYISSLQFCEQFELLKSTLFVERYTNTWIMFASMNKKSMLDILNHSIYGVPCDESSTVSNILSYDAFQAFSQLLQTCVKNDYSKLLYFKNSEIRYYGEYVYCDLDSVTLSHMLSFNELNWNKLYISLCNINDKLTEIIIIDKSLKEALYLKIAAELYANKQLSVVIINVSTIIMYRANKQQISDGLAMNDSITNLIMKECCIDDETAKMMSLCITRNNITAVVIVECKFNNDASKLIFQALNSISSLRYIVIDNTDIDSTAVSLVIKNNIKLIYIQFNCCLCTDTLKIVSALKSISSIKILDLSNDVISENVAVDLSQITSLKVLEMKNYNMTEIVADAVALAIENNKSLTALRLRNNNLESSGVIKIAQSLSGLRGILQLDFSGNNITEKAAVAIALAISSNPGLQNLHLGGNQLGQEAIKIVTALKDISTLKVLRLNGNNMSVVVANELAYAITSNSSLEELGLSGNRLTASGVVTIAESLSNVSTIRMLSFSNNEITEEAADTIAVAISSNPGLQKLYLGGNQLGQEAIKIAIALKNISTLKVLDLNDNNIQLWWQLN